MAPGLGARIRAIAFAVAGALPLVLEGAQFPTWPGERWQPATLESQQLDPAPFTALDGEIRTGAFGHMDRVLVIRHGRAVFNQRYTRDYRAISRGSVSAIGCGEGCTDPRRCTNSTTTIRTGIRTIRAAMFTRCNR